LSARNDVIANVAIVMTGLVTAYLWSSAWPDLVVGLAIAAMNIGAAREVWITAREEHVRACSRRLEGPLAINSRITHPPGQGCRTPQFPTRRQSSGARG
jgi:Co/Zn/Cd efflux system component